MGLYNSIQCESLGSLLQVQGPKYQGKKKQFHILNVFTAASLLWQTFSPQRKMPEVCLSYLTLIHAVVAQLHIYSCDLVPLSHVFDLMDIIITIVIFNSEKLRSCNTSCKMLCYFQTFSVNLCDTQRLFSLRGLKCASAWVLYVSVLLLSSQGGSEHEIVTSQGGCGNNDPCSECQQPHSRLHPSFLFCILSHTAKQ